MAVRAAAAANTTSDSERLVLSLRWRLIRKEKKKNKTTKLSDTSDSEAEFVELLVFHSCG